MVLVIVVIMHWLGIFACLVQIFLSADARPECQRNQDCDRRELCFQGSCIPACSRVYCGQNAICMAQSHQGQCKCLTGFFGDPTIGCKKGIVSWISGCKPCMNSLFFFLQIWFLHLLSCPDVHQTMIVLTILHVKIESASILAQNLKLVLQMQIVELQNTKQFAHVLMDTLVLLNCHVLYVRKILYDIRQDLRFDL